MISRTDIQKLKDIPIRDVAERLGLQVNSQSKSHCFTDSHSNGDKDPSLSYRQSNNTFKCFGCGIGGDTIDLVMAYRGYTKDQLPEACNDLANLFGITLQADNSRPADKYIREFKAKKLAKLRLTEMEYPSNEVYQTFYNLCADPDDTLKQWWAKRGLNESDLYKYGYKVLRSSVWNEIKKQYDDITLIGKGLYKRSEGVIRPTFFGGFDVVVPYFTGNHEINGFKVRTLDKDLEKRYGKYRMPIGWSPVIYHFDRLWEWLTDEEKRIYVTESETDCVATEQYLQILGETGYCVALPGAAKNLDSLMVRELVSFLKGAKRPVEVVVVADNDDPGKNFYQTLGEVFYESGIKTMKWQPHVTDCDEPLKDIGQLCELLTEL